MKTIIKISVIFIICTLVFGSCKDPLEGFVLGIKDPIALSKLEIKASSTTGVLPEAINIAFAGPDAAKIVTVLNTKKFKINKEGNLFVAVEPLTIPSAADPVEFTFAAEAEGFTKVIREFTFTSTANQAYNPKFYSIKSAPKGIAANQFEITSGGTFQFKTSGTDKQEEMVVDIPSGTGYLDSKSNAIEGNLALVVHHFDNRSARAYLPTSGVATNAVDQNGVALSDPFDLPQYVGFASIQVSSGDHKIAFTFSKPLTLTFEVNPDLINYDTKVKVKEGDVVPLMSFDDYKNQWKIEGTGKVEKNPSTNKLIVKAPVSKAAWWIAGWPRTLCRQGPRFTVKSNFTDVDIFYYYQVIGVKSGSVLRTGYISANNTAGFSVNNFPKDTENIKIRVFNYNNIYGGDMKTHVFESGESGVCENTLSTVDLSSLPLPPSINVEYKIVCKDGKVLDESSLPALTRTQFSEAGKNQWIDLVNLTRNVRKVKTYKLQVGKTYDLRASTDGGSTWPYKQSNFLIDKKDWLFTFTDLDYCK